MVRNGSRDFRFKPDAFASHAPPNKGIYELVTFDENQTAQVLFIGAAFERLGPHLRRVLARDGLLVYQTDTRTEPEIDGLEIRTSRKYGSARLTLFEAK